MTIAVAPFTVEKLPASRGRAIQRKVASDLSGGHRLRVVELSRPVSIGRDPGTQLEKGFADATRLLKESGADLLVWGTEGESALREDWNIYVCASAGLESGARQEGVDVNGTTYFSGVAESDIPEVLSWAVVSWAKLIDKGQGLEMTDKIKPMIDKTTEILRLGYQRRWSDGTMLSLKRTLSVLLCFYGVRTHDRASLEKAAKLTREVLAVPAEYEDAHDRACYQNNLGTALGALGELLASPRELRGACDAYRAALMTFRKKSYPLDWASTQSNLGGSLVMLGQLEEGNGSLLEAVRRLKEVLAETSEEAQPYEWFSVKNNLANAYNVLGGKSGEPLHLREAVRHYEEVLGSRASEAMPLVRAQVENNIGSVLLKLSERTKEPSDYRAALDHLGKAVSMLSGSPERGSGLARVNLALAKVFWGRAGNDGSFWDSAEKDLGEISAIAERTGDKGQGSNLRIVRFLLGLYRCEKAMAEKDLRALLEDSEASVAQQGLAPVQKAQFIMNRALVKVGLGEAHGDRPALKGALRELEANQASLAQGPLTVLAATNAALLGEAHLWSGVRSGGKEHFSKAVEAQERALGLSRGLGEVFRKERMVSLCLALALALEEGDPSSRDLFQKKAEDLLAGLGKGFGKATAQVDTARALYSWARLEGALGRVQRDPTRVTRALRRAKEALALLEGSGYVHLEGQVLSFLERIQ
jgi:tetratricopeptide (TPR) repeat protein